MGSRMHVVQKTLEKIKEMSKRLAQLATIKTLLGGSLYNVSGIGRIALCNTVLQPEIAAASFNSFPWPTRKLTERTVRARHATYPVCT